MVVIPDFGVPLRSQIWGRIMNEEVIASFSKI